MFVRKSDSYKSLCIRNLKRVIGILAGLLIFAAIVEALDYMYVNENSWTRILWHNFYEDKGKIDNVYIGSSHVFCDIDTAQLDEINGQYNFNLSTSGQRLNGSYYLLKEADRNNSLSHVYLELYYAVNTTENFNAKLDPIDTELHWNWNNTDNMEFSLNKLEYMFSIAGPDKYANIILPFSRYLSKLDDWDAIKQRIGNKQSEDYRAYRHYEQYDDGSYCEYLKQGYSYSTRVGEDKIRLLEQGRILEENPLGEKSEKYLRKIIKYCQKRNIPITLFVSPIDELQLISIGNYDNYINQINGIAQEYGIEFYDFNLAKEEFLSIQSKEYFRDDGHLNNAGAAVFTPFFGKVLLGDSAENKEYFYNSYAEKLQAAAPNIYGLYYRSSKTGKNESEHTNTMWIASNRNEGMEYKIVLSPDEGEEYMVQDFMENKEFTVSADEHGKCSIMFRMKERPDDVQILEIDY